MEITLPDIEVTGHTRLNSGAWSVDVRFPTNVGTIRIYGIWAKPREDGTIVVKLPAVRYGGEWRGTLGLDSSLFGAICERVTGTVHRAQRKERQYAAELLGIDPSTVS